MLSKRLSKHIDNMDTFKELGEALVKFYPLLGAAELQAKGNQQVTDRVAHICDEIEWLTYYLTSNLKKPE